MGINGGSSIEDSNPFSTQAVRDRRDEVITDAFRQSNPVLIDALPSVGKSYGVIKWAANTGNRLTVFTARHDLYDQYEKWCDEFGLCYTTLPSFHRDCKTASGEFGSDWSDRVRQKYRSGLTAGEIHNRAYALFGESLPCENNGECSYVQQRPSPDSLEEIDVLIGHYKHAYVPPRVSDRYVVFDEFPDDGFLPEFDSATANSIVSNYLNEQTEVPYKYVKQIRRLGREEQDEVNDWFATHRPDAKRDVQAVVGNRSNNTHTDAPALLYAYLNFQELDNGWEYAKIPGERVAVESPTDENVSLLTRPDMQTAKSVVALDGTPTAEKWRLILGDDLDVLQVHTEAEKSSYIREGLGIRVIQTTAHAKPYSRKSGDNVTSPKDLTLLEGIGQRHKQLPGLISTKAALDKYDQYLQGVNGIALSDLVAGSRNYARTKGINEFKSYRLGAVFGSPHYGDPVIERWAALHGESVSRKAGTYRMEQDFGEVGNPFLRDMRENQVLQAILRFGRDSGGATVYVHTGAIPEWLEVERQIPEVHTWAKGMQELFSTIDRLGVSSWTTKELAEYMSISIQMVRDHLRKLVNYGYLRTEKDEEDRRRILYIDESLDEAGILGHVEFGGK